MDRHRVVVVVGMHRSGTSAITRGMEAVGIRLGDKLIPSVASDNPKGYFEDWDITELNKEILQAVGVRWDSVALFRDRDWNTHELASLRLKATELLRRRFGRLALWGFKDPRTSRLLQFWQPVFRHLDIEDVYVIALRNPLSVARSLAARDGFAPERSYLLWLEHNLDALRETLGRPRVVVDFDALMEHPEEQLQRICRILGLELAEPTPDLAQYAEAFLDKNLQHTVFSADDVAMDPVLPDLVRRCYGLLQAMSLQAEPREDVAWAEELVQIDAGLRKVAPLGAYIDRLHASLAATESKLATLGAEHESLRTMHEGLAQELARTQQNAAETAARLSSVRGELLQSHAAMTHMEEQLRQLRAYLHAKVTELEAEKAQHGRDYAILQDAVGARDAQIASLMAERATFGAQVGRAITRARQILAPVGSVRGHLAAAAAGAVRIAVGRAPSRAAATQQVEAAASTLAPSAQPSAPVDDTSGEQRPPAECLPPPDPHHLPSVVPLHLQVDDALTARPTLNVLLPGLTLRAMSGGPNTALNIAYRVAQRGVPVRFISTDVPMDSDVDALWAHLQSISGIRERLAHVQFACGFDRSLPLPIGRNDVFMGTAWWTVQMVKHALPQVAPRRFLYLIQDFEPGLYPWSTVHALALETYGMDFRGIVNENLLARYLCEYRIGRFADPGFVESCAVFEPAIDRHAFYPEPKDADRVHRLLFYARPTMAERNLFELALYALRIAAEQGVFAGATWEAYFIGEPLGEVSLGGGITIRALPWMSFDEYAREMRRADILLSLMLSPHTSYPPLEIAACGGIAVTNEYAVKTAARIADISSNIIAVQPTVEGIVAGLRRAVEATRAGRPSEAALRLPETWDEALAAVIPSAVRMFEDCLATRG